MEETGFVQSVQNGTASVRMVASGACDSCSQSSLCHPGDDTERLLLADDPVGVRAGEMVSVRLPGRGMWMAMALVYGWPLAMTFLGAFLGYRIGVAMGGGASTGGAAEVVSALCALLFLGGGFWILRLFRPLYERRTALRPVVVEVLGPREPGPGGSP